MQWNAKLILELAAALAAAQAGLWLLARLLGTRLRREAIVAGLALPWIVLAPWVGGNLLLAPTQALAGQVAGTLAPPALEAHAGELNDAVFQFLPWELEVRRAFAARRWPFWSDRIDGGSSPWSNPQAAVLSPIAMAARLLPIQHHLLGALALKILVALQGAWLLARRLGMRRPTALAVGVSFALCGAIMAWALFPHSAAAAWAPWCVAAGLVLARGGRRSGRRARVFGLVAPRAALLAGAMAFAALLVSGQPEVAAAAGGLAVLVACFFAGRGRRGRALGKCVLAASLGAGLAAPIVVPFLALLPHSQRAGEHLRRDGKGPAVAVAAAERAPAEWFSEHKGVNLLAPLSPLVFGKPYREPIGGAVAWTIAGTAYCGLAAFLGCVLLLAARRRAWAAPFLLFAAVSLLLAADFQPLVRLWFLLPPLRLPEYARFVPVAALGLTIAGGLGLDAAVRSRRRAAWAVAGLACLLSVAVAPRAELIAPWLLLLGAVVLRRWRRVSMALVLGGVLLDLVTWSRWMLPPGDPALFYPRTAETQAVERATAPAYRAVGQDLLSYPSVLPFYGIAEPRAHNPLVPEAYIEVLRAAFGFSPSTVEYFSPLRRLDHPLRRFLGVRTIVSNVYLPPPAGAEPLAVSPETAWRLYLDAEALPRIFAARAVDTLVRDGVAEWVAAMSDPRRVAVLAEELGDRPLPPRLVETPVDIERLEPGSIAVRLAPQGVKLLATSIPGPRGWSARSGERPLRTLTVDGAFLGVVVPGRLERVELRYRPPGLRAGLVAALLAGLGLLAVALAPVRWLRPARLRESALRVAMVLVVAALGVAMKDRLDRRGTTPAAHPKTAQRWVWGTLPPESVRALVAAADPLLPAAACEVGFAGPWSGEEALFPPLWAAYFLPRCDVVPLAGPEAAGPELRLVAGEPPAGDALEPLARLPGGGLYRRAR